MTKPDAKPRDDLPRPTEEHEGLPGYYRGPEPRRAPASPEAPETRPINEPRDA